MLNLQYLRYAVEVEKAASITKAAQNLFMSQPNLSKLIRELEKEIGIAIFRRTSRGVTPTREGGEFLAYARSIISQVDELKSLYSTKQKGELSLMLSVPRDTCISTVFADFLNNIDAHDKICIHYKETDPLTCIDDVCSGYSDMSVIRYENIYESYFLSLITEKGLYHKKLAEFDQILLFSQEHPLSEQTAVSMTELEPYTEIVHGDMQNSIPPYAPVKCQPDSTKAHRRICVYDRGTQLTFLQRVKNTYMWVPPVSSELLKEYGLVTRPCTEPKNSIRDLLIYRPNHIFKEFEKDLIKNLQKKISSLQI